ncbi:hypothetical protein Tco_0892203 [Tanacetum coccineum]|uniref:Uncharacterized protein n=1 Tax=Tanacetum coccineum TaxID=301880 RepID=A0ABQ5C574_9ASTR
MQEQINKEERQRIARDTEIAKQLQEEIDIARQEQEKYDLAQALELQKELDKRKEDVAETTQAHDIDWSDHVVLKYHAQQNRSFSKAEVRKNMCMYLKNRGGYKQSYFRGMSYEDIRPIFERVWDQNQAFVPKDSEIEKEVMKRHGFDLQQKQSAEEEKLQKNDDSSKPSGGSRKKTLARKRASKKQSKEGAKRQKIEDDTEKEELKAYLDIVPGEEFAMDVEPLSTKYPIVDWKTHILTENFMYYQIIRADGSSNNYKIFSEMIDDFDRQDGDLKTLFEPDEEDEVWRNQHGYNLISWRLINSCGIHILLMDNGIAIHMMVENKYPLIQEMLSKMLNRKLEIDHESEMAFELLRFIGSQLQKEDCWELRFSMKFILLAQLSTAKLECATDIIILPVLIVDFDEGFIQKEGTDVKKINVQQGNENPEISINQVIEDAHVTISTVPKKTKVPVTSSSHSSNLASKFLKFSDIPHTDVEIVSPMDVHVHHEVPSNQTPTLLIVLVSVISDSSHVYSTVIPQLLPSFTPLPQQSTLTPPLKTEATNPLSALPNFASSQKDKDKDEDPFVGSDRGLKKRKTSKDAKPTKGLKIKESKSGLFKGTKSQSTSSGKSVHAEEPEFEVADSDMPQDQEENLGNNDEKPKEKVASKHDWFTKPKRPQEPIDPYWNVGKTP